MTLLELKQVLTSQESDLYKLSMLMIYNLSAEQQFDTVEEALAA